MAGPTPRPSWWKLYALCVLLVVAFILEARLAISQVAHQVVQIAILAFIFALIFRWIHANQRGLAQEQPFPDGLPVTLTGVETTRTQRERATPSRPMFHLPQGGLSHTLSDTIQLDPSEDQPPAAHNAERHL